MRPQIAAGERDHKRSWGGGALLDRLIRGARSVPRPAIALAFAGALGVVGILIGKGLTERDDEFWLEVAKGGVQVLAVAVIGGAVAAAWRYLDEDRERRRQLHEQQLAVFRQIVGSYNEVKAIRRTLRSLGLRASTGELNETQVNGFRELMLRLNVVQLAFEALGREVGETDVFKEDTVEIIKRLHKIEDYLNDVLHVWEYEGSSIEVGSDASVVSRGLDGLIGSSTLFRCGVVIHRREITRLIHEHLFGPASEPTKNELDVLNKKEDTKGDD